MDVYTKDKIKILGLVALGLIGCVSYVYFSREAVAKEREEVRKEISGLVRDLKKEHDKNGDGKLEPAECGSFVRALGYEGDSEINPRNVGLLINSKTSELELRIYSSSNFSGERRKVPVSKLRALVRRPQNR